MTKHRSDDSINKSMNFAFRNIFKLNMIFRKYIYLITKSYKMMNFVVIYNLQVKIMMNYYNIQLEYRLRKFEYIRYRIELVRIKVEKRE